MALKFRQPIHPGESGRDVKAVKLAYKRIGAQGAGTMTSSKRAGPAFMHTTRAFQRNHGLPVKDVYNEATHNHLAKLTRDGKPAFSWWASKLYRTAKLRHHDKAPEATNMSAQAAAKQLVTYHNEGKFHDDSGRIMAQITATAQGKAVWSPAGRWVFIDKRLMEALVEIINKGLHIGCFAMCSDHPYDGPHGHAGGMAVDISSVNGVAVSQNSNAARVNTLKLARLLHYGMPGELKPWQQICDGFGYIHDAEISACTIPGAAFYGYTTMSQHRNHVHLGYYS